MHACSVHGWFMQICGVTASSDCCQHCFVQLYLHFVVSRPGLKILRCCLLRLHAITLLHFAHGMQRPIRLFNMRKPCLLCIHKYQDYHKGETAWDLSRLTCSTCFISTTIHMTATSQPSLALAIQADSSHAPSAVPPWMIGRENIQQYSPACRAHYTVI